MFIKTQKKTLCVASFVFSFYSTFFASSSSEVSQQICLRLPQVVMCNNVFRPNDADGEVSSSVRQVSSTPKFCERELSDDSAVFGRFFESEGESSSDEFKDGKCIKLCGRNPLEVHPEDSISQIESFGRFVESGGESSSDGLKDEKCLKPCGRNPLEVYPEDSISQIEPFGRFVESGGESSSDGLKDEKCLKPCGRNPLEVYPEDPISQILKPQQSRLGSDLSEKTLSSERLCSKKSSANSFRTEIPVNVDQASLGGCFDRVFAFICYCCADSSN